MRIADSARAGGDLRTASQLYRRASNLHPDSPEPLIGLGRAMTEVGAHREAADAYREALAINPNNRDALRGLAGTLISLEQADLALEHFDKLLEMDPTDHRTYTGRGVALDTLGRHEEAQSAYRAGLAAAPEDISLRNNLGLSLAMSGQHEEAIELLRAVASEPDATPQTRQNLALALGLAGDMAAAEKISAIDLSPDQVKENLAFIEYVRSRQDGRADGEALEDPSDRTNIADAKTEATANDRTRNAEPSETRLLVTPPGSEAAAIRPDSPGPFRVQIASRRNVVLAYQAWKAVRTEVPELLDAYRPAVYPIDLGPGQGTYFRVRTEPSTAQSVAEALCLAMLAREVDCFVVKDKTARPSDSPTPSATSG